MRLSAIEEKSVTFTAASPGTLKKLGYALVDEDKEFQIRITTADDQDMVLKLAPKFEPSTGGNHDNNQQRNRPHRQC